MPIAAGVAVAGWVGATGVTAAVVTGAVAGAITGGVIGAASSLITGGNILEGALKGALIGGVTGGILNGLAEGISAGSSLGAAEVAANATQKVSASAGLLNSATPVTTAGLTGSNPGVAGSQVAAGASKNVVDTAKAMTDASKLAMVEVNKEAIKTSALYGGMTGIGQGAVQVFGNKQLAEEKAEETERLTRMKTDLINANQPGALEQRLARFTLPERWRTGIATPLTRYQKQAGLLAGGAV